MQETYLGEATHQREKPDSSDLSSGASWTPLRPLRQTSFAAKVLCVVGRPGFPHGHCFGFPESQGAVGNLEEQHWESGFPMCARRELSVAICSGEPICLL